MLQSLSRLLNTPTTNTSFSRFTDWDRRDNRGKCCSAGFCISFFIDFLKKIDQNCQAIIYKCSVIRKKWTLIFVQRILQLCVASRIWGNNIFEESMFPLSSMNRSWAQLRSLKSLQYLGNKGRNNSLWKFHFVFIVSVPLRAKWRAWVQTNERALSALKNNPFCYIRLDKMDWSCEVLV